MNTCKSFEEHQNNDLKKPIQPSSSNETRETTVSIHNLHLTLQRGPGKYIQTQN